MQEEARFRNKCQLCYRHVGKLIFDCYCIICEHCYDKRHKGTSLCSICGKQTRHAFISVEDRNDLKKVEHLFGNPKKNLSRSIEAFDFQTGIDAKYIKFL